MESKWVPGAIWGPKNPKKKKVPKNSSNTKKDHSVLEAFLGLKSEENSSLNSTCSCLYIYGPRTLSKRHVDLQMCSKSSKRYVKIKLKSDLELIFSDFLYSRFWNDPTTFYYISLVCSAPICMKNTSKEDLKNHMFFTKTFLAKKLKNNGK